MNPYQYIGIYRYKKSYRLYKVILLTLLGVLIVIPSVENSTLFLHPSPTLSMLATSVAKKQGVDPKLVKAVIAVESSWQPSALSSKGAIGLMQVHHPTWGHKWTKEQLRDPEQNLIAGTRILKMYMKESSTLSEALYKYSGGASGYADKVKRRMKGEKSDSMLHHGRRSDHDRTI